MLYNIALCTIFMFYDPNHIVFWFTPYVLCCQYVCFTCVKDEFANTIYRDEKKENLLTPDLCWSTYDHRNFSIIYIQCWPLHPYTKAHRHSAILSHYLT